MKRYELLFLIPFVLGSCRDDSMSIDFSHEGSGREVRIQAEIDQLNVTRADDSGFADGDVIGVFAVDFTNGQPGTLLASGNNSDNVAFNFNASSYSWYGSSSVSFSDEKTPMDIYGYYPYSKEVDNVESYPISVECNQNGDSKIGKMSAYEASDFLWAKSAGITSDFPTVILCFKHILASVRVSLVEGEGFEKDEWSNLDKSVLVCSTSRNAFVNFSTGDVKVAEKKDGKGIIAKCEREDYRAIVIPQNVQAGSDLLKIAVGEKSYTFRKDEDMNFLPTKQHTFTIQVNKSSSSGDYEFSIVDEAITAWESDLSSHNGTAKEYIVVELTEEESLESMLEKLSLDPAVITNLKLSGPMNNEDFEFIRTKMTELEALNLYMVDLYTNGYYGDDKVIEHIIPDYAFVKMSSLKTCVLPKNLGAIGRFAFYGTSLAGSLSIPEGVERVDEFAFSNNFDENGGYEAIPGGQYIHRNNLKGTLALPNSLKYIGGEAFSGCDFSGSLILPEGLEYIGSGAFTKCKQFTGNLRIPDSVKEIADGAFSEMTGLTDRIKLPYNLTEIKGYTFINTNINGIEWPENLRSLGYWSFRDAKFKNDLILPKSIVSISSAAFAGSNIKHVVLPPEITIIPSDCFYNCSELSDTLYIPDKVEVIESCAFWNSSKIEALVLPYSLQRIDDDAFGGCYNLNYIRCDAIEPPLISESSFTGIEKDNFTVEVPEQSVDAYRNAPGWSEFKRISAYRNFVARPSKYNVLNKGGKKEIVLNADAAWEMTECPSWCHVDKVSGSKKTTIELTVDAMTKGSPTREGKITFRLKDGDDHQTHINVGQYDYEYDEDQYMTLQSAKKGKGINIVFLGDGYDAFDISSGTYLDDMRQEMEYFFGVEPYTSYRDYFNVYTAFALSEDSGVEEFNRWRNTKFHVSIGDGCSKDGQRLSADWVNALNYCAANIPPTIQGSDPKVGCILVGNSEAYEGVTYMGESFCAVVTKSTANYPYDARGLVQHEAGGHGIGWLGDEYRYHAAFINRCACGCCSHVSELVSEQSGGFSLNLSLSGKYKEVPWSHLIFNKNYGDIVDVYEGGYFHTRGVYRSEYNSCMNNNVPYFSTWCRQLIVERIMKLAGEKFDLNSFYANDSRIEGRDFTSTSRSNILKTQDVPVRHGNAPIKITGYKYGQKGGVK